MVNFTTLLPVLAALIGAANAHTRVYGLSVNDVDQGDGRSIYVRSPPSNSPVKDVSSKDIICNVNNVAVSKNVSVNAEWYHDNRGDDIIDGSHKGPITVYIADAASNGEGAVWTKLYESGLSNGVWAVDTLISNKGKHSLTLPSSLAAGDYLIRAEIIALHEADTNYATNSARGAQFYPSCSQITVKTGGSTKPPGTFNFIGGYTTTDPGILFNLYGGSTTYTIPGPAVWDGTSSGTSNDKVVASSSVAAVVPIASSAVASVQVPTFTATDVPTFTATDVPTFTATDIPTFTATDVPTFTATDSPRPTFTNKPQQPSTLLTRTRTRASASFVAKPSAAVPKPSASTIVSKPKTPEEVNKCLDAVNACITQAQSSIGGVVNFEPCENQRASCY
ncbi:Similar to Probable endo-beta-1,4-glucanase D; acc. no. Q0CEU4 [Pyronema omphalodes CBS 100304]|uniref:AA9 family lytic polysaccharide monooxygenase n=1 Tax=Pyronema omphalodes (strain CBS 100304) TaxID=1076935 RepID=U4L486_PYROM|nr:Similar to Probable endo-beta-1,4-glucanase D; acc. no. Q0CEU4 [Pyronema omphalodes CBS 100304]